MYQKKVFFPISNKENENTSLNVHRKSQQQFTGNPIVKKENKIEKKLSSKCIENNFIKNEKIKDELHKKSKDLQINNLHNKEKDEDIKNESLNNQKLEFRHSETQKIMKAYSLP